MRIRRPTRVRAGWAIAMARRFRAEMGINTPAVDAKAVIKHIAKLYYFSSKQSPEFAEEEGFTILDKNGVYRVYINVDLPAGRDNFTYGHETSHIVLGHHKEFDVDYLTDLEHLLLDTEADIFASEYLMPEMLVREIVSQMPQPLAIKELARLKDTFKVSWRAMIRRLDELKILPQAYWYELFDRRRMRIAQARSVSEQVAITVADDGF